MKITLEPTEEIVAFGETLCRVWRGETDKGTHLMALIAALKVPMSTAEDQATAGEFMKELIEICPKSTIRDLAGRDELAKPSAN